MRQFVASTSPLKELRAFELLKIALFKFPPPGAKIVFKCSTQGPDLMVHFLRKERLATATFYSLTKL